MKFYGPNILLLLSFENENMKGVETHAFLGKLCMF